MSRLTLLATCLLLGACGTATTQEAAMPLLSGLSDLCGKSFEGNVVSDDPVDADWRAETLTVHIRDCSEDRIAMPLSVGEDRSRTWLVTVYNNDQLELRHRHVHEDGSPDSVTGYGGISTAQDAASFSVDFPADDTTKELFLDNGLDVSVDNVWTLTLVPGESLTYELNRPNRHFKATFDLTKEVATPPSHW